ncbi:acylphosphatase [Mucisphaera sp.]|uniref:acylphosphatase n=1 Tax=Mucisphaera sp. TaxID=2913024 RepID=UPI003D0C02A5
MDSIRVRARYVGRVQGVGFRMTAVELAGPYAITGFARNLPDGSVRVEAQGPTGDVEAFFDRLEKVMERHITGVDRQVVACLPAETEFAFGVG